MHEEYYFRREADVEELVIHLQIEPMITYYLYFKGLRLDAAKEAVVSTPCRYT